MHNIPRNPHSLLWLGCAVWLAACAGCAIAPSARSSIDEYYSLPKVIVPSTLCPQSPRDGYVEGVENFGFISSDVWRGAKPTAAGLRTLADMGVRTVIDLRKDNECADIPSGVCYVRLPVSAWRSDDVDTGAVLKAIEDNPKPVFIHCTQGRDRTGLAIAAYRLSQGMSQEDAMTEVSNFRANFWWYEPINRRVENLAKEMKKSPTP